MLYNCLAVGAGGALGAVARYLVGLLPVLHRGAFPLHTLVINGVGAVVIGLVVAAGVRTDLSPTLLLFLQVGVCGGFTTFSTFSLESLVLLEDGHTGLFAAYYLGLKPGGTIVLVGVLFLIIVFVGKRILR